MRFLVVTTSMAAALTLITASAAMNWVFMASLGKSDFERDILGAVSIAVSAFLALLPTLMLWAWRESKALYIALGVPVFLAFAAFSFSSAVGFAAKNRGSIGEDRRLASARLADVTREIEQAEARQKTFGAVRTSGVVVELLHGLEQDRRWQSSKSCAEATVDASRAFCREYFELKAEGERASEHERLQGTIAQLRRERGRLEDQGAGREADNQAAVLARVLGIRTGQVERGLTIFPAVLVEIGGALGLYFTTGHMRFGWWMAGWRSRRATIIEGEVVEPVRKLSTARATEKRIATIVPRRVPRMKHG